MDPIRRDLSDPRFMAQAIRLARRGEGWVEPNPMVGCVIVRDGELIGRGYHRHYGDPHAEIRALADCRHRGIEPAGADVFVTLEPCAHHGKTPPCTEALIQARPARVHVAMSDPYPEVAGRGIEAIRKAGIEVETGLSEDDARRLNAPYLKRLRTGLPWVIAKWAQTADGRIATRNGNSKWISGESSRQIVHRLRARVDAVMVGIGTAIADDPRLTARNVPVRRIARRVVVDPQGRLPLSSRLMQVETAPVTVAMAPGRADTRSRLETKGVDVLELPSPPGEPSRLSLRPLLAHLADHHATTNLLVEGGSSLLGSMIADNLVDQLLVFIGPHLVGDEHAVPAVSGMVVENIANARPLRLAQVKRVDNDVLLDYRLLKDADDDI